MRKLSVLVVSLAAALIAGALVVSFGSGSSHREAPLTSLDPTADDTDVYAFTADDAPGTLTVVANWIPFEDPAGGPNFYKFDDRATYYINVDNTGDGKYDVRYQFKFKTRIGNKESFLYALPGVASIGDSKLNVKQFYDVTRERYRKGKLTKSTRIARNIPVAPNNVGPKTIPDYDTVAGQAIRSLPGGGKVFAGQRDDPFFVDLGATFDAVTIRKGTGNQGGGKDDLAGYNVHSIVLQVPDAAVTRNRQNVAGPSAANAVVGVWSSTERPAIQVNGTPTAKATASAKKKSTKVKDTDVQVSRLGNPLVNELVIPLGKKDFYNSQQPSDDLKNFGKYVLNPELAAVINQLYPGLNVPEHNRADIVQALLTGLPGKTQIAPNAPPTDTLKINLGVPANTQNPSRFGVLAGDLAGYPDGRRLGDDVVDISERVVGGAIFNPPNPLPLGDGVIQNDVPFLASFPYVASPHAGLDSQLKRTEPATPPDPALP